ncbi:MAG: FUSC family protein [Glaciihabitans sp.]
MKDKKTTDALRRFERRLHVRLNVRAAITRVVSSTPAAIQIVVAAAASYAIAHYLLGHGAPLLAITVVIAALGFGRDARPRKVLDTVVGILVGILFSEVLFTLIGGGIWQMAVILLATMLLARLISPSAAFAAAAGVQAMLVVFLPPPSGGVLVRSVDGLIGGVVALLMTALIPRDPRGIARRDARRLISALGESLDALLSGLRVGDEPAASLAVERLRRTQSLVDDWTASLDSALSIARISPFLRRHLPTLRHQARVLQGMDFAARHLRVLARRVSFLLRDGTARPALAELLEPVAVAIALLGESVDDESRREEAATTLEALVPKLAPHATLPGAPVTESVIVLLIRPLVIDLLVASGRSADEARALLPPV